MHKYCASIGGDFLAQIDSGFYIAKTLKEMNYLTHLGYDVVNVYDSNKDRRYKVFLFKVTDDLLSAVETFKSQNNM